MRVRVVTRGMRGLLSVPALLNPFRHGWVSFQLFSHKILRWLVPVCLALVGSASLVLCLGGRYQALFAAQVIFYLLAAAGALLPVHRIWRPLSLPLYFCTVNLAALRSLWELARGRRFVTWETVRS